MKAAFQDQRICQGTVARELLHVRLPARQKHLKEIRTMKTKLNMTDDSRSQKLNETLVRDSKQLKVKTNIRCGPIDCFIKLAS